MFRVSKGVAAGIVASAVLLGGTRQAAAQTATTTTTTATTTTTTTTLLPHPFSDATAACVRKARIDRQACRRGGGTTCAADFDTAFPKCFATGAGPTCAKRCVTRESTCFAAVPATKKTCRKACVTTRRADRRACRRIADGDNLWAGGDAGCLTTAQSNFDLCKFVCAGAAIDCRTAKRFCIANCPNL
jgi:hypothetical protein